MTVNIVLNDEVLEGMVLDALIEQRGYVKRSVKELKKVKAPKPYQLEDLANDKKVLNALKVLCKYYGEDLR
jgi:hypothetical protein